MTIFEKYIEEYFNENFLASIEKLIKEGKTLKEILAYKIEDRYIFEYLEEKDLNLDINYIVVANFKEMALDLIKKGYDNIINYIYDAEILKQKIDGETILYRLLSSNVFDEDLLETLLDGLKDDCFSFEYNGSEIIESIENTSLMESFGLEYLKQNIAMIMNLMKVILK